jgi:hypothetical protein
LEFFPENGLLELRVRYKLPDQGLQRLGILVLATQKHKPRQTRVRHALQGLVLRGQISFEVWVARNFHKQSPK